MLISPARISKFAHAFIGAVLNTSGEVSLDWEVSKSRAFAQLWLESEELQKALCSPAIPALQRRAVIAQLCTRMELGIQARNLLFILSDRYLLQNYPAIIDRVEVLCEEHLGIERVQVTSSRALEEKECESLKSLIELHRKSKITLMNIVDRTVLGGIRMQIGSTVWDDTIKRRLADVLKVLLCNKDILLAPPDEAKQIQRWEDDGGAYSIPVHHWPSFQQLA